MQLSTIPCIQWLKQLSINGIIETTIGDNSLFCQNIPTYNASESLQMMVEAQLKQLSMKSWNSKPSVWLIMNMILLISIHYATTHMSFLKDIFTQFSKHRWVTQLCHTVVQHLSNISSSYNTIITYLSFHPFFCDHCIPQVNVCDLSTTCWLQGWCQMTPRSTLTLQWGASWEGWRGVEVRTFLYLTYIMHWAIWFYNGRMDEKI